MISGIPQVCCKAQWTRICDQEGCLRKCHPSESYQHVSGVPHHSNFTCPIPSHSLHHLKQSTVDMQGPWIHEVLHTRTRPFTQFKRTHQIRQRISSHQQSNVGIDGPRQDSKLCVKQSSRLYEWVFGKESLYR